MHSEIWLMGCSTDMTKNFIGTMGELQELTKDWLDSDFQGKYFYRYLLTDKFETIEDVNMYQEIKL